MTAYGKNRTGIDCTGTMIHSEAGNRKLRQLRQRLRLPATGLRMPHVCYGKTRKQTECDGSTGYTMHLLDDIVDKMIREIFRRMKGISKKDLIQARYAKELNLRKSHMAEVKAELSKATEALNVLRAEIVRCIQGESAFSQDTLAGLIRDAETKCSELQTQYEEAEAAVLTVRSC